MGSSQADKAASHERIVRAAAARIRRDGIDGMGVSELMSDAGLTHGGFYRHFGSRDELVEKAVDAALAHGARRAEAASSMGGIAGLTAIIDGYLSPLHRDKPETGCAVAALPAEIARGSARARQSYSRQVRRYLDLLVELGPSSDHDSERDQALLTLSALVGAVSMARAVDDPELSDEILQRTAHALHRHIPRE